MGDPPIYGNPHMLLMSLKPNTPSDDHPCLDEMHRNILASSTG